FANARGCSPEGIGPLLEAPLERSQDQLALVREQADHVRLGDAHAARDPLHRGAVKPAAGELVHGRADELLAPLGRGDSTACGDGHRARRAALIARSRGIAAVVVHGSRLAVTNKWEPRQAEETQTGDPLAARSIHAAQRSPARRAG